MPTPSQGGLLQPSQLGAWIGFPGFLFVWHCLPWRGEAFAEMGNVWSNIWEPHCGQGAEVNFDLGDASAVLAIRRTLFAWWRRRLLVELQVDQLHSTCSLLSGMWLCRGRYETDLFPQKIGEGQFSKAYVCWSKGDSSQRYALKVPWGIADLPEDA